MVHFTQPPQNATKRGTAVLFVSGCHDLTQKILAALHERAIHVEHHCLESAPADSASIRTDLVILDAGSHIREALVFLRNIKSAHPEVPVIILADESSEDQVIAAFRLGARDYFKKPLNIFHFLETVQNLLRVKGTCRERRLPLHSKKSQVLPSWVKARTDMPSAILKSLHYMDEHLSDTISLEALAEIAGMSKHHFCRAFKKHTGSPPIQTLHFMRVTRAKNLLKSAHHTISTVAIESGFNDIGTFIRHFKKITGITATDFRNTFRSKN